MTVRKQYVLFGISQQEYALPIDSISSVEIRGEISPVPKSPPHVLGVMALRGKLIPVISVRQALGIGAEDTGEHVLFVKCQEQEVGLCVDRVTGIRQLDQEAITASKNVIKEIRARYVEGVAENETQLIVVLDLNEMMADQDDLRDGCDE